MSHEEACPDRGPRPDYCLWVGSRLSPVPPPLAALVAGFAFVCVGCPAGGDPDDGVVQVGEWTATVPTADVPTGWTSIPFALEDADGAPVTGLAVLSDVWMPSHGHGSSESVTTAESEDTPGTYVVNALLQMAGEWEVTSQLEPDGGAPDLIFVVQAVAE